MRVVIFYISMAVLLFPGLGCTTISQFGKVEKTPFENVSEKYISKLDTSNAWKQVHSVKSPPVTFNADSEIDQVVMAYKISNNGTFDSTVEIWCGQEENIFHSGKQILKVEVGPLGTVDSILTHDFLKSVHRQQIFFAGVKTDKGVIESEFFFKISGNYH